LLKSYAFFAALLAALPLLLLLLLLLSSSSLMPARRLALLPSLSGVAPLARRSAASRSSRPASSVWLCVACVCAGWLWAVECAA
jgi:hypothetical protein